VYSRCDSKHPVWSPALAHGRPGGARCWSTDDPEVAWRLVADCLLPVGSRLVTASWRALAPDLQVCVTLVRFEHRMPAVRLAGRTANTVAVAERFQALRAPPPHLLRIKESRLSPRPRFCSPFSFETEGRITARCRLRRERFAALNASVFVITRKHHLASRSILAGSATPSARCDASPFVCERLRGFYAPFADRRRSVDS
jgi:hypothetical protein